MRLKDDLARMRRALGSRLERAVRSQVGPTPPELRRYERSFRKALLPVTASGPDVRPSERGSAGSRGAEPSSASMLSRERLLERVLDHDLVFCGDYHTYRPAQATCLELLERLAGEGPVALLLELALTAHAPHLDAWLRGAIEEEELLERMDYARNWGFEWSSYRPLFAFARANAIPILGLNGPGNARSASLAARDAWAARVIADAAQAMPGTRLLVLVGDLHLAPEHLPAATRRSLAARGLARREMVLLQNADDLYWRLADRGTEAEAVRLGRDRYCLFTGTPWARLESYLSWLEGTAGPASPGGAPDPSSPFAVDYTDRVLDLLEALAAFLGVSADGAEDFTVYAAGDPSLLPEMRRRRRTRELLPHVLASDVFLVPGSNALFLSRLDLGHAARGAAELLLALGSPAPADAFLPTERGFFVRAERRALTALAARVLDPQGTPPSDPDPARATLTARYLRLVLHALAGDRAPLPPALFEDDLKLGLCVSRAAGDAVAALAYRRFLHGSLDKRLIARRFLDPDSGDPRLGLARLQGAVGRRLPAALAGRSPSRARSTSPALG